VSVFFETCRQPFFFFSLWPAPGIFISTGPMALVALNEFGVNKMCEVRRQQIV
jgi:hypothetical protein